MTRDDEFRAGPLCDASLGVEEGTGEEGEAGEDVVDLGGVGVKRSEAVFENGEGETDVLQQGRYESVDKVLLRLCGRQRGQLDE